MRDQAIAFLISFVTGISCLLDGDFNKAFKEQSVWEKSHPGIISESTPLRVTLGNSKMCVWEVLETNSCHNNEDSETNKVSQSRVTQTDASFLILKAAGNDGESASIPKASTTSFEEKTSEIVPVWPGQ